MIRVVAVTGCDGSGKSTLTANLLTHLRAQGPTELLYLGQSSGRIAAWIRELPVIGAPVANRLEAKAARVHARKSASPGAATALTIYLLSQWRAHKFRRMLKLCRRGVLVVTDRYPQAEIPGFRFDGPGFETPDPGSWLARYLAAREQGLYRWMASHVPMLVIRLDIDADTAHARKPDHALAVLREKAATLPRLRFNGAPILALDARNPPDAILASALRAIRETLQQPPA